MVRARRIALPHERQIWSDSMCSWSINHNANFSTGPPDVQKSTRNPLTRDEARRIAVIQKIYRLGIFRTQVTIEIDVRFGAHFGHNSDIAQCLRWAKTRLMHRSKECAYSMTSSALACSNCGTVRPNALAVFIPHKLSQGCGLQAITSSTGAVALRPGKEACRLWSKSREPSAVKVEAI
jgi:hypothetical protein